MDAVPSCFDYLNAHNALEKVHSQNFNVEPEREKEQGPEDGMDEEAEDSL
jgi:hypothetical protein